MKESCGTIEIIFEKFSEEGNPVVIPMLRPNKSFEARFCSNGIEVDALKRKEILTFDVFTKTVELLRKNGGRAKRGNAFKGVLGDENLPIDSVEGYIAHWVYRKQQGEKVTLRITPIACILIWAGICRHETGELVLDI
ncbi:MAG: hypothetical protein K0R09_656 [Clostridiales bacterium]|nr:hypothetical protein [Clostridiales bacterium]